MQLPFLRLLILAARQLVRDARAGELRVLLAALLIAVAATTAIGYFSARLNGTMLLRASDLLGADLRLSGSTPALPEQIRVGIDQGLRHSSQVDFSSVIATDKGIQLTSVKAADNAYPLRGELRSAAEPYQGDAPGDGPAPGEVWAEASLLAALNLKVGDNIDIGEKNLRLTRVLTREPDRAGNFYSLTPHVLMHLDDLEATRVVQPGSRVRFIDSWQGSQEALHAYRQRIEPHLSVSQRLEDARDGNRQMGGALARAERYLNLASLAALLLAGVAVALSASRFAYRRQDASALLRCLGLSRRATLAVFGLQLLMLGLLACALGAALGWLAQLVLLHLLRELLPTEVPGAGMAPAFAGCATVLVALAGFALPPLVALGRVPPLRVLRRDLPAVTPSVWLTYGAALLALALIMWRLSLDLKLTLALLGGGLLATFLLGSLLMLGLRTLRRLLAAAPLVWRLGIGQLLRHPLAAVGQALAFGLILLAMALIALLRGELLDNWQQQLPDQAPNHFALNVLPAEKDLFMQHLARLSPHRAPLYPVVPGRLIAINGQPVKEIVSKDSRGERAIQRDLSLTWAEQLPPDNRLTAGHWWTRDSIPRNELPGVSVEAELAKSLGLKLADRLSFSVGGLVRDAQVSSLRAISWYNLQPNFYMIFQPGTLEDLPITYLTSFYLPPRKDHELVELSRAFPAVTLLQVDALLEQLRSILAQVTLAIEYVLLFVLAAGVSVLSAALQSTLDERIQQTAVLRALGARRRVLLNARLLEFALLGTASGLLAAVGCETISALLYRFAFDLDWHPHPWLLLLPVLGALLVGTAGVMGTRQALNASPLQGMRES